MSPTTKRLEEVIAAERKFWDHANDPTFLQQAFTDDALTVIEPMGFVTKQQAIEMANKAESWTDVLMQDVEVRELTRECVAVIYHGQGKRKDMDKPYQGSICSVYVKRDGDWKLALSVHQPWKPDPNNND